MREADFTAALEAEGGRSFAPELLRWVHGRGELPVQALLEQHGVTVLEEPGQLAHRLGLRVSETSGVHIKTVLRGSVAEQAGFAAGDEWLGIEVPAAPKTGTKPLYSGWHMGRLDDLTLYAGTAKKIIALVARDKRLLRLSLVMPPEMTTWRLAVKDTGLLDQWLAPV